MDTLRRILGLNGLLELVELEPQVTFVTVHPNVQGMHNKLSVTLRVTEVLERAGYRPRPSGYTVATAWTL
jgi:hypothetical protein